MTPLTLRFAPCFVLSLGFLVLAGCGGGDASPETASAENSDDGASGLPAASIGNSESTGDDASAGPDKGSPEWLIAEIRKVRAAPFPKTNQVETLAAVRRERNEQIITHATDVVRLVHDDKAKEDLFTEAVHQLMEARLQLALQGERGDVDALYEDAASLYERAPKSAAAAEAAFVRARFAHTNARRFGKQEPRWLQEFSRQSRLFATDFPQEEMRAVPLLFAAGMSCELHGQPKEAVACFSLIQQKYPKSPPAEQVGGILRRLALEGQPLQLAGPTHDGGFVSVDNFKGRPVLIVYWATDNARFQEQLPTVAAAVKKYESKGLAVIGVCLDDEELAVVDFLDQTGVKWPQIFHPDSEKRRWNNPVVRYYGVRDVPAYWLIDRSGKVVDVDVDAASLDERIGELTAGR